MISPAPNGRIDLAVGPKPTVTKDLPDNQMHQKTVRTAGAISGMTLNKRQVDALLQVSRAARHDMPLDELLRVIAAEAGNVTRETAVSILLTEPGGRFRLAAAVGLGEDYIEFLRSRLISDSRSIARRAVDRLKPVVVEDITVVHGDDGPYALLLRSSAEVEEFESLLAVPLIAGRQSFGVLTLYRSFPGEWSESEVELASTFARHAATAIDAARFSDGKRRQVEALERLVTVLREQTHEYANRLQALSGLHALGETEEAGRFLDQLITLHHDDSAMVIDRVHDPVLAGLLVAQMSVARQRGVELKLSPQTQIESLPEALGSAEAVTIISNLVENAVEAVTHMAPSRRRVTVSIAENDESVTILVRDFGSGIAPEKKELIFDRGVSSKAGHQGMGLALVSEAVASANGEVAIESRDKGTIFKVTLPCS